jgi:hypothetical protein
LVSPPASETATVLVTSLVNGSRDPGKHRDGEPERGCASEREEVDRDDLVIVVPVTPALFASPLYFVHQRIVAS